MIYLYTLMLLQILWMLLPAVAANIGASVSAKLFPTLTWPVDFGKCIGGVRIFGDHKTWRGIILGTCLGGLVFVLQAMLFPAFSFQLAPSYAQMPLFTGALIGFAALCGDLAKSFFKRRVHIRPGRPWFPFDQIDWVAGALFVLAPINGFNPIFLFLALILGLLMHVIGKEVGYALKIESDAL